MANGVYVATSGSVAQLKHLEVLSNNLAHARSAGFKADRVTFQRVMRQDAAAAAPHPGSPDKRYADALETTPRLEAGPLTQTDNPLDVALGGNAFLRVDTPQGQRLTRNGRLMRGSDGVLRTITGQEVLDAKGARIRLPPDRVPAIDAHGNITAGRLRVGKLDVVGVDLAAGLDKDAAGLFMIPARRAPLSADAQVLQGWVEESNVQPVGTMLDLIKIQRTFSALRQVITTQGELDKLSNRLDG